MALGGSAGGERVLITGMGGELGTRVAMLLEAEAAVDAIAGMDLDPPRRRLHRAEFWRIDPRDRERVEAAVTDFAPTTVVHLGTYEPSARCSPTSAIARTASGTIATLRAAASTGSLEHVVVRSGIEVYGRRRGAPDEPTEDAPLDPTTPWGHSLLHAERVARDTGAAAGASVCLLRSAPFVGPHFPSPLGRLLRLPVVPVSAGRDPSFTVLHQEDAARAFVAAVQRRVDGPVNVVAEGTVTAMQAALVGRRLPLLVTGPGWRAARAAAELAGAPIPAHVHEQLTRGRRADGSRVGELLGIEPRHATVDVIRQLHAWTEVTYLRIAEDAA
jgi:UDP-glucose 4-epimerase